MELDVTVVAILKIPILEVELPALVTMQQLPMIPTAVYPKEVPEIQPRDQEQDSIHLSHLILQHLALATALTPYSQAWSDSPLLGPQ